MPAKAGLPEALIGADGGVGVRVSPHPVARELCARLGRPITATSANLAGQPPAACWARRAHRSADKVKVFLEGGVLGAAKPSTVVAFDRGDYQSAARRRDFPASAERGSRHKMAPTTITLSQRVEPFRPCATISASPRALSLAGRPALRSDRSRAPGAALRAIAIQCGAAGVQPRRRSLPVLGSAP